MSGGCLILPIPMPPRGFAAYATKYPSYVLFTHVAMHGHETPPTSTNKWCSPTPPPRQMQQQQPRQNGNNVNTKWSHSNAAAAATTGMGMGVESLQSPVRIRRSAIAHPTGATAAASSAIATGSRRHGQQRGSANRGGGRLLVCMITSLRKFSWLMPSE